MFSATTTPNATPWRVRPWPRRRARGVVLARPSQAVVVGDTPLDIACARAAGARVVAVATGGHSLDELRACTPDLALPDLSDLDAVVNLVSS